MNIQILLKGLSIIRAICYLYITVEAFLLGYMYWNAYRKYKTTSIIKALEQLLFSIGVAFFYMNFLAIMSFLDSGNISYYILVSLIPIFCFPLVLALKNFREKSTEQVEKNGEHLVKSYKFKK